MILYTSVEFIHVYGTEIRRFQVANLTEVFFVTNVGYDLSSLPLHREIVVNLYKIKMCEGEI